jgi:uncharacterized protein
MSSNRELVQSLYDAFARGDAGTVLGALHPEVAWNGAESNPYAVGSPFRGPQRVGEEVFGPLLTDYENFAARPERLVAEGDTVVALGRYSGTHRASGQPLDAQFAHAWTVEDGKITHFQQYTDTAQWQRLVSSP